MALDTLILEQNGLFRLVAWLGLDHAGLMEPGGVENGSLKRALLAGTVAPRSVRGMRRHPQVSASSA